jgi:catechol 2,3-dioxygenase-like lactoylglutathione lyase family enzyme
MAKIIDHLMHLSFRIKNYERSLKFYCEGLGLEKMFSFTKKDFYEMTGETPQRGENLDAIWLTYLKIADGQYLELFPVPDEEVNKYDKEQSFFHFSLQVDDVVEAVKRLEANGITVYRLHKDILENKPVRGKFIPLKGGCNSLIAWIKDPDGNLIEIMEITSESLQRKHDKLLSEGNQ